MMDLKRVPDSVARRGKFCFSLNITSFLYLLFSLLLVAGCYESGTKYAPGYSEVGFESITIGDTKDHVVEVLGQPLRIVGHLFIYRYLERAVNFTVNTESGDVSVSAFLGNQSDDQRIAYESVKSLDQLTEKFGPPDKILRAHRGQSDDPDVSSYIYSDEDGSWWKVRVVFIHKLTGKVVDKWAFNMSD